MQRKFLVHVERDGFRQIKDYYVRATSLKEAIQKTADKWTNGNWHTVEANADGTSGKFINDENSIKFVIKRKE